MLCESCRTATAQIQNDADDVAQPYAVCQACNARLEALALRPLEWFNLAAIHGPNKHLLHDDFYDEDGTAFQPEAAVENPDAFPAPTLMQAAGDVQRVVDFAITQWLLRDDVVAAIATHEPARVLEELIRRTESTANAWVESCCYEICARALGEHAAAWVRSRSGQSPDVLFTWAQAAAACLPFDEGWRLTLEAVNNSPSIREDAQALAWFRTPLALDWLQSRFPDLGLPVTEDWGRLAAVSQLSWSRVTSWLALGRPMSLVALDGAIACFHYNTLHLKIVQPKLIREGASRQDIETALTEYTATDGVPRVARAVKAILANLDAMVDAPF